MQLRLPRSSEAELCRNAMKDVCTGTGSRTYHGTTQRPIPGVPNALYAQRFPEKMRLQPHF